MWVAMYQETNEVAVLLCIWSVSGIWGSVVGVCGSLGTPVIRVHPPLAAPEWALPGSEGSLTRVRSPPALLTTQGNSPEIALAGNEPSPMWAFTGPAEAESEIYHGGIS